MGRYIDWAGKMKNIELFSMKGKLNTCNLLQFLSSQNIRIRRKDYEIK